MKNKLILLLLGLLGISVPSCSRQEYGCPYDTYTIKGKVTDTEGNGIQAIIVSAFQLRTDLKPSPYDAITDLQGNFSFSGENRFAVDSLFFTDPDGYQNGGRFISKGIAIDLSNAEMVKREKGWFRGDYLKIIDVTLDKEK